MRLQKFALMARGDDVWINVERNEDVWINVERIVTLHKGGYSNSTLVVLEGGESYEVVGPPEVVAHNLRDE